MAEIDWKREFDGLGVKGVRSALMGSRWDADKRAAAREWLERGDTSLWRATRASRGGEGKATEAVTSLSAFRRYQWVYYVAGAAFGLLGLARMFNH